MAVLIIAVEMIIAHPWARSLIFLAHRRLSTAGIIRMGNDKPFGQLPLDITLDHSAQVGALRSILESNKSFPPNSCWPIDN